MNRGRRLVPALLVAAGATFAASAPAEAQCELLFSNEFGEPVQVRVLEERPGGPPLPLHTASAALHLNPRWADGLNLDLLRDCRPRFVKYEVRLLRSRVVCRWEAPIPARTGSDPPALVLNERALTTSRCPRQ